MVSSRCSHLRQACFPAPSPQPVCHHSHRSHSGLLAFSSMLQASQLHVACKHILQSSQPYPPCLQSILKPVTLFPLISPPLPLSLSAGMLVTGPLSPTEASPSLASIIASSPSGGWWERMAINQVCGQRLQVQHSYPSFLPWLSISGPTICSHNQGR